MHTTRRTAHAVALAAVLTSLPVAGAGAPAADRGRTIAASTPTVGPTEIVSDQAQDAGDYDSLPARIVVGWGGQVTAVWYRPDADIGFLGGRLYASVRGADGAWSDPVPVSEAFELNEQTFDAAAGESESVSVVWTAQQDGARSVFEAHRDQTGWSTPQVLGQGLWPQTTVDGTGETSVLWVRGAPTVVSRTADGTWSSPRTFADEGGDSTPGVAASRAGDEVAMWAQVGDKGYRVRASLKARSSTTWPRAAWLHGKPFDEDGPGLGIAPNGRVLAAWSISRNVVWSQRSLAGGWSPVRQIAGDVGVIGEYGDLEVSVNRRSHALARWNADTGGTYVARYRPGDGFGKPVRLSRDRWPSFGAVGEPLLTGDGTAIVAGSRGQQVAYRWQSPGQPWSTVQRLDPTQYGVAAVGARGTRLAVLFRNEGLHVRVIDVKPTS